MRLRVLLEAVQLRAVSLLTNAIVLLKILEHALKEFWF